MTKKKPQTKKPPVLEPKDGRCNNQRPDGTFCMRRPIKGRDRCQKHGGKAKRGPEHHAWKGGTSKSYLARHIPHRLAERFEAALDDPDLLSLRSNLALSATRLGELLEKLPTRESAKAWEEMRGCLVGLRTAIADGETKEALSITKNMTNLMSMALAERALWEEILETQEHHRRLADTERKREDHLQAHVTAAQFSMFLAYFYRVIMEVVSDPAEQQRIADRIRYVMEYGPANPKAYLTAGEVDE